MLPTFAFGRAKPICHSCVSFLDQKHSSSRPPRQRKGPKLNSLNNQDVKVKRKVLFQSPESADLPQFVGTDKDTFHAMMEAGLEPLFQRMQYNIQISNSTPLKTRDISLDEAASPKTRALWKAVDEKDLENIYLQFQRLDPDELSQSEIFTVLRSLASDISRSLASASRVFHVYKRLRSIYPDAWTEEVIVAMHALSPHPAYLSFVKELSKTVKQTDTMVEILLNALLIAGQNSEARTLLEGWHGTIDDKIRRKVVDSLTDNPSVEPPADFPESLKLPSHLKQTLDKLLNTPGTDTLQNTNLVKCLDVFGLSADDEMLHAKLGHESVFKAMHLLNLATRTLNESHLMDQEVELYIKRCIETAPRSIQVLVMDLHKALMIQSICEDLDGQTAMLMLISMNEKSRSFIPPTVFSSLAPRVATLNASSLFFKQVWKSCDPRAFQILIEHFIAKASLERVLDIVEFGMKMDPLLISNYAWDQIVKHTAYTASDSFQALLDSLKRVWLDSIQREVINTPILPPSTWQAQKIGLPNRDEGVRQALSSFFADDATSMQDTWYLPDGFPEPFFKWEYPLVASRQKTDSPVVMFDETWDNQSAVLVPNVGNSQAQGYSQEELRRLRWIHIRLSELYNARLASYSLASNVVKGAQLVMEMRSLALCLNLKTYILQMLLVRRLPLTKVALGVFRDLVSHQPCLVTTAASVVQRGRSVKESLVSSSALVKNAKSEATLAQLYRALLIVLARSSISRDSTMAIDMVLKDVKKREFSLGLEHYSLINRYYVRAGLVQRQAALQSLLIERGLNPEEDVDFISQSIMGMLTSGIHNVDDATSALAPLVAACEKTGRSMPVDLFSRFIFENLRKRRSDKAVSWIEAYQRAMHSSSQLALDKLTAPETFTSLSGLKLDAFIISPVLTTLIRREQQVEAWDLFGECVKSPKISKSTKKDLYKTMIKFACRRRHWESAEELVIEMLQQGLEPDRTIYHALLKVFLSLNMFEKSRALLASATRTPFRSDVHGLGRWWAAFVVDRCQRHRLRAQQNAQDQVETVKLVFSTLGQSDYRWFLRDLSMLTRVYSRSCLMELDAEEGFEERLKTQESCEKYDQEATVSFATDVDAVQVVTELSLEDEGRDAVERLMPREIQNVGGRLKRRDYRWEEYLEMAIDVAKLGVEKFAKPVSPAARRLLLSAIHSVPDDVFAKNLGFLNVFIRSSVAWDYFAAKRGALQRHFVKLNVPLMETSAVGNFPREALGVDDYGRVPTSVAFRDALLDRAGKEHWNIVSRMWTWACQTNVNVHLYHHRNNRNSNLKDETDPLMKQNIAKGEWFDTKEINLARYIFPSREMAGNFLDVLFKLASRSADSLEFCRVMFATSPLQLDAGIVDFGLHVRFARVLLAHEYVDEAVEVVTLHVLHSPLWELLSVEPQPWTHMSTPSSTWKVSVGQLEWAWETIGVEICSVMTEGGHGAASTRVEAFWTRRIQEASKQADQHLLVNSVSSQE